MTKRAPIRALSCLLVGLLLVSATGLLEAAGHDHGPSKYCRICSSVRTADVSVSSHYTPSPRLQASPAPAVVPAPHTGVDLLTVSPQRGPPLPSQS